MRNFFILIVLTIISGCELKKDIDIVLPEGKQFYILEGYVIKNHPLRFLLYKSNTMHGPVVYDLIWNASVKIIGNEDTIQLRNIIYTDNINDYLYNYRNDEIANFTLNYKLQIVTSTFDTIIAETDNIPDVKIDSLRITNNFINIFTANTDNANNNYYLVRLINFSEENKSKKQLIFNCSGLSSGCVKIDFPFERDTSIDSVYVNLYRINKEAFNYHTSLEKAYAANHDPFTIPCLIEGNISNGLGIFTCCSLDTCILKF